MRKQEIFDKVARHLLRQKKKARDAHGCRYRVGDLRCAIGCLIPKRLYKPIIEGKGAYSFVDKGQNEGGEVARAIGKKIGLHASHRKLLQDLQSVHDFKYPPHWLEELQKVARKHRLNQKVLR